MIWMKKVQDNLWLKIIELKQKDLGPYNPSLHNVVTACLIKTKGANHTVVSVLCVCTASWCTSSQDCAWGDVHITNRESKEKLAENINTDGGRCWWRCRHSWLPVSCIISAFVELCNSHPGFSQWWVFCFWEGTWQFFAVTDAWRWRHIFFSLLLFIVFMLCESNRPWVPDTRYYAHLHPERGPSWDWCSKPAFLLWCAQ